LGGRRQPERKAFERLGELIIACVRRGPPRKQGINLTGPRSDPWKRSWLQGRLAMTSDHGNERGVSRRKVLECMTWAGTGVLWTVAGGVPSSMGIIGEARAVAPSGLTFLQISDSHVGFDKPANP